MHPTSRPARRIAAAAVAAAAATTLFAAQAVPATGAMRTASAPAPMTVIGLSADGCRWSS